MTEMKVIARLLAAIRAGEKRNFQKMNKYKVIDSLKLKIGQVLILDRDFNVRENMNLYCDGRIVEFNLTHIPNRVVVFDDGDFLEKTIVFE